MSGDGADGLARLGTQRLYKLRDGVARLTQLSRVAIGEQTTDDGATWTPFYRGYTNRLELEGGEYAATIGDTTRIEQQTELFRTLPLLDPASLPNPLPMPAPRVGLILGGPIAADPTYGLFAGIEDFGACRFHVDEQHSDQGPFTAPATSGTTRVLRLKFDRGYLRPWYDKPRTKFESDEWDTVNGAVEPYFVWDPKQFASPLSATVNYFGFYPNLVARLTPAGGGATLEATPIARPVRFESGLFTLSGEPNREKPKAEYDALVGNDSTIYLAWGDQPWPGIGAAFDVTLFSRTIADANPVLLAGHPVDLLAYAAALIGIPVDEASRVSCRAALGDGHWFEGLFTPQKFNDFAKIFCGGYRFLFRVDQTTGLRQLVPTGPRPASTFAVTQTDRVSGSDDGASQPPVWTVAEDSVVNVVTFERERLRRYVYKTDSGDVPIPMLVRTKATLEGARGDTSVNGERTVTYAFPGQLLVRAADGSTTEQPQAYYEDVGGVVVDFAGWGTPQTTVLLDPESPAASAQVGDEGTLDLPDLPTPLVGGVPLTTRGAGPRVVRVVKRTPQPGAVEVVYAHAGELSQTATAAPAAGGSTPSTVQAPTLTLAASTSAPTTVATVTLTNGATLGDDNLRTELEYLAQTATPAGTDAGTAFGPVTTYPLGNATTLDVPAVAPGSKVWVRALARNVASGVASAWTTWASVTLGTAVAGLVDGTTTIPAPTLVPHLVTGALSVDVTHPTAATVKLATSTTGPVTLSAVRAATPTTLVSGAATVATGVTPTGPVWIAAFTYDSGGNESQLGTTLYSPTATGAPTTAEYLVGAADATLTAERVVTDTTTVAWDLATAGQAKATVPDASLGIVKLSASGTRDATTFLRGDGTFAVPSGGTGGGGTTAWLQGQPDAPADYRGLTPNAADDEFEAGSAIDTTGARRTGATAWVGLNTTGLTTAVARSRLVLTLPSGASDIFRGYLQAVPTSGAWRRRFKFLAVTSVNGAAGGYVRLGLLLRRSSTDDAYFFGLWWDTTATPVFKVYHYSTLTGGNVAVAPDFSSGATTGYDTTTPVYLEVSSDGTTLTFAYATSGEDGSFVPLCSVAQATFLGGAPDGLGPVVENLSTGFAVSMIADFFRDPQ